MMCILYLILSFRMLKDNNIKNIKKYKKIKNKDYYKLD